MFAWYCQDHRPLGLPPYPKEAESVGREIAGR